MSDWGPRPTDFDLISPRMKMNKSDSFAVIANINWPRQCVCCRFPSLFIPHAFQPPVNKRDDRAEKPNVKLEYPNLMAFKAH